MSNKSAQDPKVSTTLTKSLFHGHVLHRFELDDYFTDTGKSISSETLELVALDQQQRWLSGQQLTAEVYVARFPQLLLDRQRLVDLVYHEYLLLELLGPSPKLESFVQRFPDLADDLREQVAFHLAMDEFPNSQDRSDQPQQTVVVAPTCDLSLPDFLNRYRPLRKLGAGSMGDVYLAQDLQLERQVAIKLPKVDGIGLEQANARFLREAKALAALQHPNISQIFDFGQDGDQFFIVMPYLAGQTLGEYLQQKGMLATDVSLQLVAKIAIALETAHRLGIAHRDLKPSNIMLDGDLEPTVMDFGLVAPRSLDAQRLTSLDMIPGTPAYLAPERLNAPDNCNRLQADIYSLGVVLYELLAGRLPHDACSNPQMLARILTETPKPPSWWNPGISADVDALCLKAIAKSPHDRYASMQEFASALFESLGAMREFVDGSPAKGMLLFPVKLTAGRRSLVRLFLIGAFMLVGGLGLVMYALRNPGDRNFALRVGDILSGSYTFLPDGSEGDAELSIEQVDGQYFAGKYQTENGEYVWAVEGHLVDTQLDFELVKALSPAAESVEVVGQAHVSGVLSNFDFVGEYQDEDSEAEIVLTRRKP